MLGPVNRRRSFMLSPVAGVGSDVPVSVAIFGPGAGQSWTVPPGVGTVLDIFAWGSGGDAGASGVSLGGGGGGGGAFASTGQLSVVQGTTYAIAVDGHGSGGQSSVTNPGGSVIASAGSGQSGAVNIGGASGQGNVGAVIENGGNGSDSTGLAGAGGGGGGAAGNADTGSDGAGFSGGPGGGSVGLGGFGTGGTGGDGSQSAAGNGNDGGTPGAGGGGGHQGGNPGLGADGLVLVLYLPPLSAQAISVSIRQDVRPGSGTLNYLPGTTYPTVITDSDVGSMVEEQWWIVSGVDDVPVQITEFIEE
jgi:hypothetical protein